CDNPPNQCCACPPQRGCDHRSRGCPFSWPRIADERVRACPRLRECLACPYRAPGQQGSHEASAPGWSWLILRRRKGTDTVAVNRRIVGHFAISYGRWLKRRSMPARRGAIKTPQYRPVFLPKDEALHNP